MALVAFLYPSWTSCRKAKSWLDEHGVAYILRHIFNEPPTAQELRRAAAHLPGGAGDLLSQRSTRYKELAATGSVPEAGEALIALLAREPRLLRRPILLADDGALVGYDEGALRHWLGTGKGVE